MFPEKINRLFLLGLLGLLTAVSVVSGCAASRPDTVTLVVKDQASFNLSSSGFSIRIGDWKQEKITGGEYEIPLPDGWITGSEIRVSIVEDLMGGFGKEGGDLYTGQPFDVWNDGVFVFDESGLAKKLVLNIGEAVAYFDKGAWGNFKVSPQSGRLPYIRKSQSAASLVSTKLQEVKEKWEERERQNNVSYYYRCGLDFPWKLKRDGSWGGVSYNTIELYFIRCSLNIETVYASQARNLAKYVSSSQDYLEGSGKLSLLKSLESVANAMEDLANTYQREGMYLGSQSDFDKALVFLKASNAEVDRAIASAQEVNIENARRLRTDATNLSNELLKHCVKDGTNCR